jgi:hypothetical protein
MSKIIEALNVMIDNKSQIKEAVRDKYDKSKFYFRYLGPRVWTVERANDDSIVVRYYPNSDSLSDIRLARIAGIGIDVLGPERQKITDALIDTVGYSDQEWTSSEAKATFRDFYKTVQETCYQVDKELDQIIASGGVLRATGS